jgi:hypothetical protein
MDQKKNIRKRLRRLSKNKSIFSSTRLPETEYLKAPLKEMTYPLIEDTIPYGISSKEQSSETSRNQGR